MAEEILIGGGGNFLGEVSNAQFTSYSNIAALSGISQGTIHGEGSGFLKFILDTKELLIPKKPIRLAASWDTLNAAGCVFGQKQITVGGVKYKVRLLTGADSNPAVSWGGAGIFVHYYPGTHNSEWSRLFYPIIKDDPYVPIPPGNLTGPYTSDDLEMNQTIYQWCQETASNNSTYRIIRGANYASDIYHFVSSHANNNDGWRPCLEKV